MSDETFRINPETGVFEKESFGLLGSTWVEADEDCSRRVNQDTGVIERKGEGIIGSSWFSDNENYEERINPETGVFEKGSSGLFGSGWSDRNENYSERINPENGEIQKESYGFLGSSWVSSDDNATHRINRTNGEFETESFGAIGSSWTGGSGGYSSWETDEDEDYYDDDDEDSYETSSESHNDEAFNDDQEEDEDDYEEEDEDDEDSYETSSESHNDEAVNSEDDNDLEDDDFDCENENESFESISNQTEVIFNQKAEGVTLKVPLVNSVTTVTKSLIPKIDAKSILQSGINFADQLLKKLIDLSIVLENSGFINFNDYLIISTEISNFFCHDTNFVNSDLNLKLFLNAKYEIMVADSKNKILFNGLNNPQNNPELIRKVFESQLRFYYESLLDCIESKNQLIKQIK